MTENEAFVHRLMTDFPFYASVCMRIKTKDAQIAPLVLNRAQLHTHKLLEDQLARKGRIRANILKGRQQGLCLDPETRVLTADLRWVRIKDVAVGDRLVACDERPLLGACARKMRTSVVEKLWGVKKEAYTITFDDGRQVTCSGGHRWLSKKTQTQASWRSVVGRAALRVGDCVRVVTDPWDGATLSDAWFGGMVDGEGSIDYKTRNGVRMAVSQRAGAMLDALIKHCEWRGYAYHIVSDDGERKTKHGKEAVHAVNLSAIPDLFRMIGLSRPVRFTGVEWWNGKRMPDSGWKRIVDIRPVGEMDLIDIQTDTKTFIAEGFVSHNSTYIGARFYWKATTRRGIGVAILTHMQDATDNLFGMVSRYHKNCPNVVRASASTNSAKALHFDKLDSGYSVATAGSKGAGRSRTIQLFHGSEAAFWPNPEDHMMGIGQTVPSVDGSEIILETTANGLGNFYHKRWTGAENADVNGGDYENIFIPWFWQEEYRAKPPTGFRMTEEEDEIAEAFDLDVGQIAWRRKKIMDDFGGDELRFNQEYPNTAAEAFTTVDSDPYIKSRLVIIARKCPLRETTNGALIVGVDPARFGNDNTGIIRRRGRVAYKLEIHKKKDTMHIAGVIANIIKEEKPDKVFIDIGGLGAGIYDRLIELHYGRIVQAVNFGGTAVKEDRYANKRAEMWGEMKEWLEEQPSSIPDDDALHGDITGPQYTYDSLGRVKLEKKEDMIRRGIPSPDRGDSLALTFAYPVQQANPAPGKLDRILGNRGSGSSMAA